MSGVPSSELQALRETVARLEAENAEQARRAQSAVTSAGRQAAALHELGIDLNALMRRRGAAEARAAFRGARLVYWVLRYRLWRELRRWGDESSY